MEEQTIDEIILNETTNRISEMQGEDYEFPSKISKIDVIAIAGCIIICIFLIILAMSGVIE